MWLLYEKSQSVISTLFRYIHCSVDILPLGIHIYYDKFITIYRRM